MRHQVVAANAHYYKTQTDERYIDRTLQHHDLIYLIDGGWSIAEGEREYALERDDVLLLAADTEAAPVTQDPPASAYPI